MKNILVFMALVLSFVVVLSACSPSTNLDKKEDANAVSQTAKDNTDITPSTDITQDIDASSMDNLDQDISAVAQY